MSVGYLAGLRWSEILGLRWSDLQLTGAPEIRIRADGGTKTHRDQTVPMSPTLSERLTVWMAQSENVGDNALVFPHPCHVRTVHATWQRIQQWANIAAPFRFHDLRVSFCTNLVAAGVQTPILMKLARHRSIATTLKYYRGKTEDADRKALAAMEAAFSRMENDGTHTTAGMPIGERNGEQVLQN